MPAQFILDNGALKKFLTTEATRIVRDGQRAVLNSAKLRSPVDTGALRSSHTAGNVTVSGNHVTAEVEATQDYAMFVHEGTRPHVIRPRRAKVLTWGSGAGRAFARSVNHPGTRRRPWLLNATKAEAPRLGFVVTPG